MSTQQLNNAPTVEAAHAMGAKGGPTVEAERLAFEAWMNGHCWALCAEWDGTGYRGSAEHGNYLCPRAMNTRQLWAAWRDRAALAAPQPAPAGALDEVLRERDEAEDFINELLDEVLGADRPDWSSAYNRYDAMSDVRECITALHKPAVDKAWDQFQSALAAPQPAQGEPVAWIEHEWSGTGLRHLHFEKREPMVRDEVVNPVWTPLYTAPQTQRQPLFTELIAQHPGLAEELAAPQPEQEPLFWYRPCSNGMYEGPIHNAQIERVRKKSGAWAPLYTAPQHQRQPLADEYVQQLIAEASALDGADDMTPEQCFEWLVRRVEKAHGITKGPAA